MTLAGVRGVGRASQTASPAARAASYIRPRRSSVGKDEDDDIIEIPHEAVADVTTKTGFRAHRLALRTPRNMYHCWVHRKSDKTTLKAAAEFIENAPAGQSGRNRRRRRRQPSHVPRSPRRTAEQHGQQRRQRPTKYYRGQPIDDDSD